MARCGRLGPRTDLVIVIVDTITREWPCDRDLIAMGIPRRVAEEWQAIRRAVEPETLKLLAHEARN